MNWEAIKHIYYCVLIHNHKIEYLGGNKYKIISHANGITMWEAEYENNSSCGRYIKWDKNGTIESVAKTYSTIVGFNK